MKIGLKENQFLHQIGSQFRRPPNQLNQLLESDAELLLLADGTVLAVTTDCIAEEISTGLYSDPEHIGWMTVVVNLSDLAAVGAQPLGLLLSESLPHGFQAEQLNALQHGIEAACTSLGISVLGGDTNTAESWQMGGTAIGIIPAGEKRISRKGAKPGDLLYASGRMGLGSAYAFSVLFVKGGDPVAYRPLPRLDAGAMVRQWGSTCIDTSDGFFHALANLMEINQLGFKIETAISDILHPEAVRMGQISNLPGWIFLAGPHGEFELLFTVPANREAPFLEAARTIGWSPQRIGVCLPDDRCTLPARDGSDLDISPARIANAFTESDGNPELFLQALLALEATWQIQKLAK